MKFGVLILVKAISTVEPAALPRQPRAPLSKDHVMDLVKFGMNGPELATNIIIKLGIDFDLTDDYIQSLQKSGAKSVVIQALRSVRPMPLTHELVGTLVAGGVPSKRAVALVRQRGIDFLADEKYLQTLQLASTDASMVAALRKASASAVALFEVQTSPHAEVRLDSQPQ
jgi:hypothetical protein